MNFSLFNPLRAVDDVCFHPGSDPIELDKLADAHGIVLPIDHRLALLECNGAEVYDGYVRLFGVDTNEGIDASKWNDQNFWKFSWNGRCSNYWCFAETAWGDQYAYQIDKLRNGDTSVYFLDCISMTPTPVAASFSEFMDKEFVRSAKNPYDRMIVKVRKKFGHLDSETHLIYVPSILLGGDEKIAHVQKMNARSAMICNGDIATQLDAEPKAKSVKGVTTYEDEAQRMRLRLVWF